MIYAIGDLHLDSIGDKPMDVFGENWKDHEKKIWDFWIKNIDEDDLVLLPGDISWALKLEEAIDDLERLNALPGNKIISKGNHDYWWSSLSKMNGLNLETINFIQNNSYTYKDYNITGTRGWFDYSIDLENEEHNKKIYNRELNRLELSLKSINKDISKIIVMLHYPPFDRYGKPNDFLELCKEYNVNKCIYGHLHGEGHRFVKEGYFEGIEVKCTSADYIDFKPIIITR